MTKSKISISLPNNLLNFLDHYQEQHNNISRSEIIKRALELLKKEDLGKCCMEANSEINNDFDNCNNDGLDNAPW